MQRIFDKRFVYRDNIDLILETMANEPEFSVMWPEASIEVLVKDMCSYRTVPKFTLYIPNTMYVQKNWPYTELINYQ